MVPSPRLVLPCFISLLFLGIALPWGLAGELDSVLKRGSLRHLGVPYANFVTGSGDGLDVELIKGFARHLGVGYEFVETSWKTAFYDLTGKRTFQEAISPGSGTVTRGDLLACGLTILPWREELVNFSAPTFLSQVWLIARAKYPLSPIVPGRDLGADIAGVKALLRGRQVLGVESTCLEPRLYGLDKAGAKILYFKGRLNELAPAVINNDAGLTLLDVPDALVALQKWPGQIKVIGPVSGQQKMAVALAKSSPRLGQAFNRYFETIKSNGKYEKLVRKYYPGFFTIYPDFL